MIMRLSLCKNALNTLLVASACYITQQHKPIQYTVKAQTAEGLLLINCLCVIIYTHIQHTPLQPAKHNTHTPSATSNV